MSRGSGDVEIKVNADASMASRVAKELKASWTSAGEGIQSAMGSAANAIIGDLSRVAPAQGRVNFSSQHQQVREFEAATARFATAAVSDAKAMVVALQGPGAIKVEVSNASDTAITATNKNSNSRRAGPQGK